MARDAGFVSSLSPSDAVRVLLNSLPLAAVIALVVAALTYFASDRLPSSYESSSIVIVPRSGAVTEFVVPRYQPSALGVDSYVMLAESLQLRTMAGDMLGTPSLSLDDIDVSAGSGLETDVIEVVARGGTPQEAVDRADALASALVSWDSGRIQAEAAEVASVLRRQATSLSEAPSSSPAGEALSTTLIADATLLESVGTAELATISIGEKAIPDPEPIWPQPTLWAAIAGVASGLLAAGLALLRAADDDRVTSALNAAKVSGLPILAELPQPSRGQAAYFRTLSILASQLQPANRTQTSVVLFTSPDEGRARTITVAGLAAWLASNGSNTALIDADLEQGRVTKLLRLKRGTGFGQMLSRPHDESLKPASVRVGRHGAPLRVVPSFEADAKARIDLSSIEVILRRVGETAETVLVDVPPSRRAAEVFALAPLASAVVLVVTLGATRSADLRDQVEMYERAGIRMTGVVVAQPVGVAQFGLARFHAPIHASVESVQSAN